ncbi:ribose/galactose ABC transporter substrate-binding protein [Williamsoniiplasma somnilux]|uniref:Ribose/galactose ABC transporter substrate-binding protein n=1 Tax=Williamsoniiplasma somnilux TaxID=215578 RepID=A0A2K8NX37_9MOLU|nr:lipoprotein [Williamsoniiplasma somnilux]ATZ18402.1 ribose/galactose ABC transporter substrate-binding protein [Williamsoniiplasma somnilux]
MKKLLTILTSVSVLAGSVTSVISCTAPKLAEGLPGQRVVIITDGGNIRDKSFNESSWEGVIDYGGQIGENVDDSELVGTGLTKEDLNYESSKLVKVIDGVKDYSDAKNSSRNYVEVADKSRNGFYSAYKMALYKQTDAMLLSGFGHTDTIDELSRLMGDKTIVLLDSQVDYSGGKYKNVISIIFKSELAGFAAGWDALMWANVPKLDDKGNFKSDNLELQGDANGDGIITLGSFGGISMKLAVDNYIWGLLAAGELFNETMAGQEVTLKDNSGVEKNYKLPKVAYGNLEGSKELPDGPLASSATDSAWFSNNFDIGGAEKSGVVPKLFKNKSDIIFPVAGPQTNDVIGHEGGGYKPFLIGVDTDQIKTVGKDTGTENRFITSAIKGIATAAVDELKAARSLKKAEIVTPKGPKIINVNDPKKIHDGQLAETNTDWSVSISRNADQKYSLGQNLAIKAVDYSKNIGKILYTSLSDEVTGFASLKSGDIRDYFTGKSIKNAIKGALNPSTESEILNKKDAQTISVDSTIENDGIDGLVSYFNRLLKLDFGGTE